MMKGMFRLVGLIAFGAALSCTTPGLLNAKPPPYRADTVRISFALPEWIGMETQGQAIRVGMMDKEGQWTGDAPEILALTHTETRADRGNSSVVIFRIAQEDWPDFNTLAVKVHDMARPFNIGVEPVAGFCLKSHPKRPILAVDWYLSAGGGRLNHDGWQKLRLGNDLAACR